MHDNNDNSNGDNRPYDALKKSLQKLKKKILGERHAASILMIVFRTQKTKLTMLTLYWLLPTCGAISHMA